MSPLAYEPHKNATVMLVDDEPTTVEALQVFLEEEGYRRVIALTDATQVMERVRAEQPDVLLLDLTMPGVSGLEILLAIRADPVLEDLPVIIFTASKDAATRQRALELGANDFLTKPANPPELALRLRNALTAKQQRDRMRHHLEQLQHRVEDDADQLGRIHSAAARSSHAKSRFLENVGREIHAPLGAICEELQVVVAETSGVGASGSLAGLQQRAAELLRTVQALVDLAELDGQTAQAKAAPVDLVELLVEVVSSARVRSGREIALEIPAPVPAQALCDGPRLRRAVAHLVDHALRQAPHGSVTLRLGYHADGFARIDVADTGPGIPPDRAESLFLDFERAESGGPAELSPAGLPLAVARRLARLLGGDCTLASDPGGGRAQLAFPAPPVEHAELRSVDADELDACLREKARGAERGVKPWSEGAAAQATTAPASEAPEPAPDPARLGEANLGATIMMVDDEATTLDVIEAFLEGEGYSRFVRTSDAREALDLFARHRPDIVLLDLLMPHVDGLQILEAIRGDRALPHTPVVILTASNDVETRLKALELGATDFLSKPVDASELALRLRNTLAAKAYQDRLAFYDPLTELANRRQYLELLHRALDFARRRSRPCAVLHINLDRFKQINETLGHEVGDELLQAVAARLQTCARGILCRIGGDEFSVILPRMGRADSISEVARRILDDMADPFSVAGQDLFVSCGIGIAIFPNDGDDVETLIKHANVATTHAKGAGTPPYQFYRKSLNAEAAERLSLESALRGALFCDEIVLFYQPVVDLASGSITGAEALLRWKHPEKGLLTAGEFIQIAEETDIILSLGEWTLSEACRQTREWLEQGRGPFQMAVNVSSSQFRAGNLVEQTRAALAESGLDGRSLLIELTERQIMEDPQKTSATLGELQEMGVKIAVDDFGTGHSSLTHLKRFPLDQLKIDRSFVSGVPENTEDTAIVSAIVGLAHNLGLTVVAEGVETPEQLGFLRELGCDAYQGFHFSRPAAAADLASLFDASRAARKRG